MWGIIPSIRDILPEKRRPVMPRQMQALTEKIRKPG
jgi:hypothetical protein